MSSEDYLAKLLSQRDITICPNCINNSVPNKRCKNLVCWKKDASKPFDKGNTVLVCCFVAQQIKANGAWNGIVP